MLGSLWFWCVGVGLWGWEGGVLSLGFICLGVEGVRFR